MYKYDTYDQAMVDARVEEFRDQVRRRLEGHITEDQFTQRLGWRQSMENKHIFRSVTKESATITRARDRKSVV